MVVFLFIAAVFGFGALFSDTNTPQSSASQTPVTNNAKATSTGPYSAYPCDFRDKVSPIDGKPCSENRDQSVPAPSPGFKIVSNPTTTNHPLPAVSVTGVYVGTVNNQTANLNSSFTVVVYSAKTGVLEGCLEVKPPLYGSGVLRGSVTGSRVNFAVADITFQGDASKDVITGSYVVTRQAGNQLGTFRLTKQPGAEAFYGCADGTLVEVETQRASNSTVETPVAPAETRASLSKQPDLSGLTSSERQSIEAACSHAKYSEGPAAYDQCLHRQLVAWTAGSKQPDLSSLTSSERQSIEAACSHPKYSEGPAAYDQCLYRQLEAWAAGPKQPNLSGLNSSERQSIEAACSHAKYSEGPLAYDRCLIQQRQALTNYHQ
jgi:hypothetical protein